MARLLECDAHTSRLQTFQFKTFDEFPKVCQKESNKQKSLMVHLSFQVKCDNTISSHISHCLFYNLDLFCNLSIIDKLQYLS